MKKALLLVALAFMSEIFAAQGEIQSDFQTINKLKYGQNHIAVGTIADVQYEEKITFKPDIAEFSITYLTEGSSPNNASNRNVKNMDELKKYLQTLGVKEKDISTVEYRNYQQNVLEPIDEKSKKFTTKLTVLIKTPQENLYNIIELLEKNGIDNLEKYNYNDENLYHFTIEITAQSENTAKKNTQIIFEKISKDLENSGITHIDIKKYETAQASEDEQKTKKYFVSNTIKIKTSNFDNIGKIFTKAQELKMTINNDLHYSVSDEQRQKVQNEIEGKLFEKLYEKAKRLIGKNGFSLGAPTNISIQSPYANYNEYSRFRKDAVLNSAQLLQTQEASEVSINPPSEYETILIIHGSFDILQEIKK
ncbi:MAG: SIMPL domain-containing protein [Campylobacteraceae bacterium]|nr:SIMPL domain-containing protein [Campylobacteraceae bacterium]